MVEILAGYDVTFWRFGAPTRTANARLMAGLFDDLVGEIENRASYVCEFLSTRQVAADRTHAGIAEIDEWLKTTRIPEPGPSDAAPWNRDQLPPEWCAFAVDVGLLVGEADTQNETVKEWAFNLSVPRDYQRCTPVIRNVPGLLPQSILPYVSDARTGLLRLARATHGLSVVDDDTRVRVATDLLGSLDESRSRLRNDPRRLTTRDAYEIRRRRTPSPTPIGSPEEEDGPRLSVEEAREGYARDQASVEASEASASLGDLRPDQVARYLKHHEDSGEIQSSSEFTIVDAADASLAREIIDRDTDDGGKPSAQLRKFAEHFMDIWPDFGPHPQITSPYEDDLLSIADSTTLTSEFFGSESLIEAMMSDLHRLTSEHGLYLYWSTTNELIGPS